MKKFLPLFTVIAALLTAALIQHESTLNADVVTKTFTTNETACVWTNNLIIDSIQLSAGTILFTLEIYDNSSASLTYVNTAYTNRLPLVTNLVTTVITEAGLTNTFTNKVLMTVPQTIAAATNTLPAVMKVAVNANESSVVPGPIMISKGIVLKNTSGSTNSEVVIINYHKAGE